jgi:hypothetical protein
LSDSKADTLTKIKAVLEQMRISELQWEKEQSEKENLKTNDPSSQSKTKQ